MVKNDERNFHFCSYPSLLFHLTLIIRSSMLLLIQCLSLPAKDKPFIIWEQPNLELLSKEEL